MPPDPQQLFRDLMAANRFRKARDLVKPLAKTDPAVYLPLLVEANAGLARELTAKGLHKEAEQVMQYLSTIASAERLHALREELAAPVALPAPVKVVAGAGKPADLAALDQAELPEAERQKIADAAVLHASPPAEPQTRHETDLAAVHAALRQISAGELDAAVDTVRPLPRTSAFLHWRTFVRGLAAFYRQDHEKAETFFVALPPESGPGRCSRPFRLVTGGATSNPPGPVVSALCELTGEAALDGPLQKAERAWKQGHPTRMIDALCECKSFPAQRDAGLIGEVSAFAFQCWPDLTDLQRGAYYQYLHDLADGRNPVLASWACRAASLVDTENTDASDFIRSWQNYIRLQRKLGRMDAAAESLAHAWLGDELKKPETVNSFRHLFSREPVLRNTRVALEELELAARLDPSNLDAWLSLCDLLGTLKQTSARNRLIDQLCVQFPAEKSLQLLGAGLCFERKAYPKGLKILEKLLEHDRLDPAALGLQRKGWHLLAAKQAADGRMDLARRTMAGIEPSLSARTADLDSARWMHEVRCQMLEECFGDPALAADWAARAEASAPSPTVARYAAVVMETAMPKRTGKRAAAPAKRWQTGMKTARAAEILPLLAARRYFEQLTGDTEAGWREFYFYGIEAAKNVTDAERIPLLERASTDHALKFLIDPLVEPVFARDPHEPLVSFLFTKYLVSTRAMLTEDAVAQLLEIEAEARKRQLPDVAARAAEFRATLAHRSAEDPDDPGIAFEAEPEGDGEFEDDDDDDDDDDDPDENDAVVAAISALLEADERTTADLLLKSAPPVFLEAVRAADARQLEALRNDLPLPLNDETWEWFVGEIRSTRAPQPRSGKSQRGPTNHPDLFD